MTLIKRKIIEIDESLCDGCANCIPGCPEQAIEIVETDHGPKAKLVRDLYCDGLGACLGHCPTGALQIIEKEVEPYNEEMTIARIREVAPEMLDEHLQHMAEHADELPEAHSHPVPPKFGGCPSARMQQWGSADKTTTREKRAPVASELHQWPIQLHLVPPFAPYFKNANLAIIADCVPFSYANFHQDFVKGRAIAVGCPKLDDMNAYLEKIAGILKVGQPKSVEVVIMEVPCCSGLTHLVKEAARQAGVDLPITETVLSIQGNIKREAIPV